MVIHTGDIVDASNSTQWQNANKSMSVLLNANIPYCWMAGNHDQWGNIFGCSCANPDLDWDGSHYLSFNSTSQRAQNYWVDDCYNSKNTAVKFSFNQYSFLIIGLEYHANSSVMAWAKNLLDKSSGSNVIVAAHSYLNDSDGYGVDGDCSWETNLRTLVDKYPNVFLTLSGHDDQIGANMTRVGTREEVFFDRQALDQQKGAAAARIYTFNLTSMQVKAKTYSVYQNRFLNDSYNNFNFNTTLQNDKGNNIFPYSYFWVSPDYQSHISFTTSCSASLIEKVNSKWSFTNLKLNGVVSNLSVTACNANIAISDYNPNGWINCCVSGDGGGAFSLDKAPVSVFIDGAQDADRWTFADNMIEITNATTSIDVQCAELSNYPLPTIPSATGSNNPPIGSTHVSPTIKPATPTPLPSVSETPCEPLNPTQKPIPIQTTSGVSKMSLVISAALFVPFIVLTLVKVKKKYG
jgi:hypothetical protein